MKYLCALSLLLTTCSQPPRVECGPGTREQDGVCVAQPQSQKTSLLESGLEGTLTTKTTSFAWQSLPSEQDGTLYDMTKFLDSLFVVGQNGTILRSDDQGKSWESVKSGTTKHLYDSFASSKYLFACGAEGTVLRSKDGKTWEDISPAASTKDLLDISTEGNTVLAIGQQGTIIYAAIEPATKKPDWQIWPSETTSDLSDATKKGGEYLIVGSAGALLRGSKPGDPLELTKIKRRDLIAVRSQGKSLYVVADDGSIYRQRGAEWEEVTQGTTHRLIDFWETGGLFTVGDDGAILRAADFGKPWEEEQSGTPNALFGTYRAFDKRFALGDNGLILVSEPWNLLVSNKAEVPLRVRTKDSTVVIPPKQLQEVVVAEGNTTLEYIDEEANVFQLPFEVAPQRKYKLVCATTPEKRLECQDPTDFTQ